MFYDLCLLNMGTYKGAGGSRPDLYPETLSQTIGTHLDSSRSKTEVRRRCGELFSEFLSPVDWGLVPG